MVNEGTDASVGRTNHIAPDFERAHACDLEVLMRRYRITEPGVVTDVNEQARVREGIALLRPVGNLITDGYGELGAVCGDKQRLRIDTCIKVRVRQCLHTHPLADEFRHWKILAERHQVSFTIHLSLFASQHQHAVENLAVLAALKTALEYAEHH